MNRSPFEFLPDLKLPSAGAARPVPPRGEGEGAGAALGAALQRLEEVLDEETAALEAGTAADFTEFSRRKSRSPKILRMARLSITTCRPRHNS